MSYSRPSRRSIRNRTVKYPTKASPKPTRSANTSAMQARRSKRLASRVKKMGGGMTVAKATATAETQRKLSRRASTRAKNARKTVAKKPKSNLPPRLVVAGGSNQSLRRMSVNRKSTKPKTKVSFTERMSVAPNQSMQIMSRARNKKKKSLASISLDTKVNFPKRKKKKKRTAKIRSRRYSTLRA